MTDYGIPDVWFIARCPISDEELEFDDGFWCPSCRIAWDDKGQRGVGPVAVERLTLRKQEA